MSIAFNLYRRVVEKQLHEMKVQRDLNREETVKSQEENSRREA